MFVNLSGNRSINTDGVRKVSLLYDKAAGIGCDMPRALGEGCIEVVYTNGVCVELFSQTKGEAAAQFKRMTQEMIVKIIPCHAEIYNVFADEGGDGGIDGNESYRQERVHFFALCIDGSIKSLSLHDGVLDFAEKAPRFVGYFGEDMPEKYKAQKT
jgi:hypothetical protein